MVYYTPNTPPTRFSSCDKGFCADLCYRRPGFRSSPGATRACCVPYACPRGLRGIRSSPGALAQIVRIKLQLCIALLDDKRVRNRTEFDPWVHTLQVRVYVGYQRLDR